MLLFKAIQCGVICYSVIDNQYTLQKRRGLILGDSKSTPGKFTSRASFGYCWIHQMSQASFCLSLGLYESRAWGKGMLAGGLFERWLQEWRWQEIEISMLPPEMSSWRTGARGTYPPALHCTGWGWSPRVLISLNFRAAPMLRQASSSAQETLEVDPASVHRTIHCSCTWAQAQGANAGSQKYSHSLLHPSTPLLWDACSIRQPLPEAGNSTMGSPRLSSCSLAIPGERASPW